MNLRMRAPSSWQVIRAIFLREAGIAWRRWLVRFLLLASVGPPLVFGIIIIVRIVARETSGFDLSWDPVVAFLQWQVIPVTLLALGLGTPLVARDRSEDVLYLYAVRPVGPWHYAVGKMLAVALPAFVLLLLPGVMIAVLRRGLMPEEVGLSESFWLVAKVTLAALFFGVGVAGVSVGPSAATRRARWALFIAVLFFFIPDAVGSLFAWGDDVPLGPMNAVYMLLESLLDRRDLARGIVSVFVLSVYAALGVSVTMFRVRQEMTP